MNAADTRLFLSASIAIVFAPMLFSSPLHAGDEVIVGREVLAVSDQGVGVYEVTLRLSVFSQADRETRNVVLRDRLAAGVELLESDPAATVDGDSLVWALGALPGHEEASAVLHLRATGLEIGDALDEGASAVGQYYLTPITDEAAPATLPDLETHGAYLPGTPDADRDDYYIRRQAALLDYDPMAIEEWVRDEIRFEAYTGSLRGARVTLWSGAGNALDQASLAIALLRAGNIPARYQDGVIAPADATRLIDSMFPLRNNIQGLIPDNFPTADPGMDAGLIAEVTPYTRIQYWQNGNWRAANPCFTGVGPTFTPGPLYAEIDDSRRHKLRLRITVESVGFLGVNPLLTPVDVTLNTVDIAGEPITVGHATDRTVTGFFGIFTTVQDYLPFVAVGSVIAATGEPYKEQWASGIAQVEETYLVAEWLDMDVIAPGGAVETYRRTLFDRFGPVRRANGEVPTRNEFVTRPTEPAISELDFYTIYAPTGRIDSSAAVRTGNIVRRHEATLAELMPRLPETAPANPTPEQQQALLEASALVGETSILTTRTLLLHYLLTAQDTGAKVADSYAVRAYADSPQLLLAISRAEGDFLNYRIDLRRTWERVLPDPGQTTWADFFYRSTRTRLDAAFEHLTGATITDASTGTSISTFTVHQAAEDQGIEFRTLTPDTIPAVEDLEISDLAKLNVRDSLERGKMVLIPARAPVIGDATRVAWLESDPVTGETFAVSEDGGHQVIIQYVAVVNGTALNQIVGAEIGAITGFFSKFYAFTGGLLEGLVSTRDLKQAVRHGKELVALEVGRECADAFGSGAGGLAGPWGSVAGGALSFAATSQPQSFADFLRYGMAGAVQAAILDNTGIGQSLQLGMCYGGLGALQWIMASFDSDPEVPPYTYDPTVFDTVGSNPVGTTTVAQAGPAGGLASGTSTASLFSAAGALVFSVTQAGPVGLPVSLLTTADGEVRDASHNLVAGGSITLASDASLAALLETSAPVLYAGTGTLTSYANGMNTISVDWQHYHADVAGPVELVILGNPIINGTARPHGLYRLSANGAEWSGEGACVLAESPPMLLSLTEAILGIGSATGEILLGGTNLAAGAGIGLATYTGTVFVSQAPESVGLVLDGTATDSLRLVAPDLIINTSATDYFHVDLTALGGAGDEVTVQAVLPGEWTGVPSATGTFQLLRPPLTSYEREIVRTFAESRRLPGLMAQAESSLEVIYPDRERWVELRAAPEYFVVHNGAVLPSVLEIRVTGFGPGWDEHDVRVQGTPPGAVRYSRDSYTPHGLETHQFWASMFLDQPLPPRLSQFRIEAYSTYMGSVYESAEIFWTMPEVRAASMTIDLPYLYYTESGAQDIHLAIRNTGNWEGEYTIEVTAPAGFEAVATDPGPLLRGEYHRQVVSVTNTQNTPGAGGIVLFRVLLDGEEVNRAGIFVEVTNGEASAAARRAAQAARERGWFELFDSLASFGGGLEAVEADLASAVHRDAAIQLSADMRDVLPPEFAGFGPRFAAVERAMAGQAGAALGEELLDLAAILQDLEKAIRGAAPLKGDVSRDRLLDWRDLFEFQRAWRVTPPDPAEADLDEDGAADEKDLLDLLELVGE